MICQYVSKRVPFVEKLLFYLIRVTRCPDLSGHALFNSRRSEFFARKLKFTIFIMLISIRVSTVPGKPA